MVYGNYKMTKFNEDTFIENIVCKLISKGKCGIPSNIILTEEKSYKFQILKMICQQNDEDEELQVFNLMKLPTGEALQRYSFLFLIFLKEHSIKEMILGLDAISDYYNVLEKEKIFSQYLNEKKIKMIPFLIMIAFIAYLNFGKDISEKIKEFIKKNYIKSLINDYRKPRNKSPREQKKFWGGSYFLF